jgi:hypothetical protein
MDGSSQDGDWPSDTHTSVKDSPLAGHATRTLGDGAKLSKRFAFVMSIHATLTDCSITLVHRFRKSTALMRADPQTPRDRKEPHEQWITSSRDEDAFRSPWRCLWIGRRHVHSSPRNTGTGESGVSRSGHGQCRHDAATEESMHGVPQAVAVLQLSPLCSSHPHV